VDQREQVSTHTACLGSDHALGCHRGDGSVDGISPLEENPPTGFGG
jgi:hypothetical protein